MLSAGGIASPQLLMLSGVGPAEHLGSLGIEVVQDFPGVGQNLRDHPMGMIFFRETGAMPGELEAMARVLLRYTVEGSSTRNDMQISYLPLDSAYLPATVPITGKDNLISQVLEAVLFEASNKNLTSRNLFKNCCYSP